MDRIRYFPIALYIYVLGAAGLGFGVGVAMSGPTQNTLIIIATAFVMTMIGYVMMRPYMRQAKDAIKAHALARVQQPNRPEGDA